MGILYKVQELIYRGKNLLEKHDGLNAMLNIILIAFILYLGVQIYWILTAPKFRPVQGNIMMIDYFTQSDPMYDKELALYQSLDNAKKQEYLQLSKDEKFIKYKTKLT